MKITPRQQKLLTVVETIYATSTREMGHWMWKNHVQWVANKTLELARKYGADSDLSFAGAMVHDLADAWLERDDPEFDQTTDQKGREALGSAGFSEKEVDFIFNEIVAKHSCYEGQPLPETLEGQVMATADAMYHLATNFFKEFEIIGQPTSDPVKFKAWALKKLNRDFERKLRFEDEKNEVEERYKELIEYFNSK